jgi:threonine dehydrogenase-like Zn-dependent dehydrogenase
LCSSLTAHIEEQKKLLMISSNDRMRAARLVAPQRIELEDVPRPVPAADEVLFQVDGSGVCSSNLEPWFGLPWTQYPFAAGELGHEAWGTVAAIGRDVHGLRVGDPVVALSYRAFAEYDLAKADGVLRLPSGLAGVPFPGEIFGCAFNIFERSRIAAGQDVAIVGLGFLGAVLTRLCSRAGARVIAVSRRAFSLNLARQMGAAELLDSADRPSVVERVRELTAGKLCDRVIEATGKQAPLDLATELTGTRGLLVIAGYHQDGPRNVNLQLWNWRGLDVVNAHERDPQVYLQGMRKALDAIDQGELDPRVLCTHGYPLERLAEALTATEARPAGFVKAWVAP